MKLLLLLLGMLTMLLLLNRMILNLLNLSLCLLLLLLLLLLLSLGLLIWLMLWVHPIQRCSLCIDLSFRKGCTVLASCRSGRARRQLSRALSLLAIVVEVNKLFVPHQKITDVHVSSCSHNRCVI